MSRIEDLQHSLKQALESLPSMHADGTLPPVLSPLLAIAPPRGMAIEVALRSSDRGPAGNHQRVSPDRNWDARHGEVLISFAASASRHERTSSDPLTDLIAVQLDAEHNPQLNFVALKLLRDRLLPQTHLSWTQSPEACQAAIGDAIERGILVTTKQPNPRNPAFPVTAIHLNRDHDLVRETPVETAATAPTSSRST